MSKVIPGVPENITRADYIRLIESVGFEFTDLYELRFATDGIHAVVLVRNAEGNLIIDTTVPADEPDVVKHEVYIPVCDEPLRLENR